MTWEFLSPEQRASLDESLDGVLPDPLVRSAALAAIDMACARAQAERHEGWNPRAVRAVRRSHMLNVVAAVDHLTGLLATDWPLIGLAGLDRERWLTDATMLRASAQAHADGIGKPPPGRPPLAWRDDLVAVVYSVFPEGTALKAVDSLFESVVQQALEMLGAEVEDVHSVIIDALKRQPEPPFRVEIHRKG